MYHIFQKSLQQAHNSINKVILTYKNIIQYSILLRLFANKTRNNNHIAFNNYSENINKTLPMLVFLIRCGVVSLHFKAGDFFEILKCSIQFFDIIGHKTSKQHNRFKMAVAKINISARPYIVFNIIGRISVKYGIRRNKMFIAPIHGSSQCILFQRNTISRSIHVINQLIPKLTSSDQTCVLYVSDIIFNAIFS